MRRFRILNSKSGLMVLAIFIILKSVGNLYSQQPTSTAPLFVANSQYLQGRTWADYKASAGAGLTLNIAAGTAYCGSPPVAVAYAGGTLTMTDAATNYVFLNPAATCVPASNTTGFSAGHIPLATVVTSGGAITSVIDRRTWFTPLPCSMSATGGVTCAALGTNQNITLTPSETGYMILNGNVGIGTTTPLGKLEIWSADTAGIVWDAILRNPRNASATGYGAGLKFRLSNVETGDEPNKWFGIGAVAGTTWALRSDLVFYGTSAAGSAAPAEVMRITGAGDVGIGTTAPAAKLDVAGSQQVSSAVANSLGGYMRTYAEATGTPAGTTNYFDIAVDVPTGAKLLGAQLRVDTALTAGETWGAAYITGSTTTIAAPGQAVAKNTKVNKMHIDEITTAVTKVRITRDSGNFTNGVGVIRAIVYYEQFTSMGSLP